MLHRIVAAMLTAGALGLLAAPAPAGGGASSGTAIPWTRDFEAGLKEAKATGRPILLNFYCGT